MGLDYSIWLVWGWDHRRVIFSWPTYSPVPAQTPDGAGASDVPRPPVYGRAWHSARALAFRPELAASGLARRPCDLRHAALSLWLNAGGDPAQIAARAWHSVAVLPTVYSHCIHDPDDLLNQKIGHVLEPSAGRGPCPSVEKPAVAPTARRARPVYHRFEKRVPVHMLNC